VARVVKNGRAGRQESVCGREVSLHGRGGGVSRVGRGMGVGGAAGGGRVGRVWVGAVG